MFKRQVSEQQQILQTIQLTAKLQNSLRKIMSNRRNNIKTQYDEKELDRSQMSNVQGDLRQLKSENKELLADNERLCRDVLRLKEQNRELRGELAEHKKYIAYLQGYTQDLKKELVFWMRKPTVPNAVEGEESFGALMTEVLKLRKENEMRQVELGALKSTIQPVRERFVGKHKGKNTMPLFGQSQMGVGLQSKGRTKKKGSVSGKTNECTSCNYLAYANARKRHMPTSASFSHNKGKGALCGCHSRFVQTSQFMH